MLNQLQKLFIVEWHEKLTAYSKVKGRASWPISKYCPHIHLEGQRKALARYINLKLLHLPRAIMNDINVSK
jgi:hypothetical protein